MAVLSDRRICSSTGRMHLCAHLYTGKFLNCFHTVKQLFFFFFFASVCHNNPCVESIMSRNPEINHGCIGPLWLSCVHFCMQSPPGLSWCPSFFSELVPTGQYTMEWNMDRLNSLWSLWLVSLEFSNLRWIHFTWWTASKRPIRKQKFAKSKTTTNKK